MRTSLATTAALGALGLLLVGLAAGADLGRLRALGPGLVWLGLLYGAIALAERLEAVTHENDAHSAFWLVLADRRALYLGSVAALAALLAGLVVALTLLAGILMDMSVPLARWPIFLMVVGLGALAAAAVSALVAALLGGSGQRALLAPVLLLPLLAPTLLAGSGALTALLAADASSVVGWTALLAAQAALFGGLGLLTFEAAAAPE
jgi:heme exporter protein B